MGKNVSQQLIGTHRVEGRMEAGQEIARPCAASVKE